MTDYRPVYSNKKRFGIALLALFTLFLGFIFAVVAYFGLGQNGVSFIVAAIVFLISIGITRTIYWVAFHGRKPEWSDVPSS